MSLLTMVVAGSGPQVKILVLRICKERKQDRQINLYYRIIHSAIGNLVY